MYEFQLMGVFFFFEKCGKGFRTQRWESAFASLCLTNILFNKRILKNLILRCIWTWLRLYSTRFSHLYERWISLAIAYRYTHPYKHRFFIIIYNIHVFWGKIVLLFYLFYKIFMIINIMLFVFRSNIK